MPKRKRAPGIGTYIDEETGEVVSVQTTKAARTAHKKSGAKWYKEPTEVELRMWERDDRRKAFVEEQERKEELKWRNAEKRREREERDQLIQQDLYVQGKITYTQTLAKKSEDQRNLHKWLGGRPSSPCSRRKPRLKGNVDVDGQDISQSERGMLQRFGSTPSELKSARALEQPSPSSMDMKCKSNPFETSDARAHGRDIEITPSQYQAFLQDDLDELETIDPMSQIISTATTQLAQDSQRLSTLTQVQKNIASVLTVKRQPTLRQGRNEMTELETFDIAVDDDVIPQLQLDCPTIGTAEPVEEFKIPALPLKMNPVRQVLSPLSNSTLNIRAPTSNQSSCCKEKLLASMASIDAPTQVYLSLRNAPSALISTQHSVQNLFDGICTQDLSLDGEDLSDKENMSPILPHQSSAAKPSADQQRQRAISIVDEMAETTADVKKTLNDSFSSVGYDEIFAGIDPDFMINNDWNTSVHDTFKRGVETTTLYDDFNFEDDELDDHTLLSLPATQILHSFPQEDTADPQPQPPIFVPLANLRQSNSSQRLSLTQFLIADLPTCSADSVPLTQKLEDAKKPLPKSDSFATLGFSDDDLLEGLQDPEEMIVPQQQPVFERHRGFGTVLTSSLPHGAQQHQATTKDRPRTAPASTTTNEATYIPEGQGQRLSSSCRKRRILPWQLKDWTQRTHGAPDQKSRDEGGTSSQETDLWQSQGDES